MQLCAMYQSSSIKCTQHDLRMKSSSFGNDQQYIYWDSYFQLFNSKIETNKSDPL